MAGDWIKMRSNLWDDPRVAKVCDITDQPEAAVIGAMYWLWAMADQHTEDGILPGLSLRQIDRKTGVQGFAQAMCEVGWLAEHPEGVRIVRFEEHNGASAKKRAATAKRVASHRSGNAETEPEPTGCNADVTQQALQDGSESVTCALAREEKRREESSSLRSEERQRASRLPADWTLPDEWAIFCRTERPDLDPLKTAERFADYWRAKPGAQGRKLDWLATWRNWVRNERAPPPGQRLSRAAENAAVIAELTGGLMAPKPKEQSRATGEIIDV